MLDYWVIRLQTALYSLRDGEEGQTLVEYSLIIALVSVALVTALTGLKTDIANVFTNIGNAMASAL